MERDEKIRCTGQATKNYQELFHLMNDVRPDLIMVGHEDLLVDGTCEKVKLEGFKVFGPSEKAAALEGSKIFSKEFMKKYQIPTADFWVFTEFEKTKKFLEEWSWENEVPCSQGRWSCSRKRRFSRSFRR